MVFVDLKVAFDNVDREKLWEILERKGIDRRLIMRLKRIYVGTRSVVRTKDGLSDKFVTRKGVKQGCVLSPLLFNLYVAELDDYLRKRGVGGVALESDRIWLLAYANDMMLVAKNRVALIDMLDTLKLFLKKRALELNVDKNCGV